LNANIFRDGLDYAVYITTDTMMLQIPAEIPEAITWAKNKSECSQTFKIRAEASLVFPLLVAATFKKIYDEEMLDKD